MSVAWIGGLERRPSGCCSRTKGATHGLPPPYPTPRRHGRGRDRAFLPHRRRLLHTRLNPRGDRYGTLNRLSDSEVVTLALLQQLRGTESQRSFLRDAERFFSHLFPGVVGLAPSSLHRRIRKLRRFLEPLRRGIVRELVGDPETLIVDSALFSVLHPRQVKQSAGWGSPSAGAAWVRWGSFSVYGVKLHLLCPTNRVPLSYELTAANVAEVKKLAEELLETAELGKDLARRLFGDLAYRSEALECALAETGILLVTERSRQHGARGSRWK